MNINAVFTPVSIVNRSIMSTAVRYLGRLIGFKIVDVLVVVAFPDRRYLRIHYFDRSANIVEINFDFQLLPFSYIGNHDINIVHIRAKIKYKCIYISIYYN